MIDFYATVAIATSIVWFALIHILPTGGNQHDVSMFFFAKKCLAGLFYAGGITKVLIAIGLQKVIKKQILEQEELINSNFIPDIPNTMTDNSSNKPSREFFFNMHK